MTQIHVTITGMTRRTNTVEGNPRWRFECTTGAYSSADNTAQAAEITGFETGEATLSLDRNNKVVNWTWHQVSS